MSDNHRGQIYENLIVEETEELLDIWQFGKIDEWDEVVFKVIKEILLDRLGYVPPQSIEFQISEIIYRIEDYLESDELEKALSECELAIQLNPDFAIAYNYRGEIYEEMEQFENAIINYQKAVELSPSFKDAWESMLRVESVLEEEFEESTTKKQLEQALKYAKNGETNKALEQCESIESILPSIASAYNYLGSIFDTLDMLELAINSYRKAIQLNPESKDAWENLLSIELVLEEEFEESVAKKHLDQALEYANDEELEKALAECKIAKPLIPNLAIAYNYLGLIFQTLNQLEYAIESYLKAVQLNPRFYTARENLANAKVAWEEEQYRLVKNENPNDVQETSFEFDESKIQVINEPIPQWLFMDEKAFLLVGWAGYRTRYGRSGYDPLERDFEYAHIQGTIIRALLVGRFRTRKPLYLFFLAFVGVLYFMYGTLPFTLGSINGFIAGIIYSPYSIVGILLLVNVYRSIRLEKLSEYEDNGYTFF
ncbi:MAG: tetratricopeptide repeat protein [Chloroflexi bacterium]|nr:tetratricopeptide repeat protein [Chloroflexota bacterium]